MQMHTVASRHIVLVARIDEEVRIRAGVDAGFHERKGVLRHAGIVVVVMDNHQMSLQVTRQVFQVALLVPFRVALRSVHVAFAVHHFVISPVDVRTAGYTYFKDLGLAEEDGTSPVSATSAVSESDAVSDAARSAV